MAALLRNVGDVFLRTQARSKRGKEETFVKRAVIDVPSCFGSGTQEPRVQTFSSLGMIRGLEYNMTRAILTGIGICQQVDQIDGILLPNLGLETIGGRDI
jgi:hypothetical protein